MLKIEKTLQSVRDLLDRLGKEGVEFTLVESEYSDYIADIRNPNKVYVFLECSIRPNGTFVWRITTIIKESATSTSSACG